MSKATPPSQPAPASSLPSLSPLHDVVHQERLVREALQSEKRHLGFFIGAGCPLGIYDAEGKRSLVHIPDVAGLTQRIEAHLQTDASYKDFWGKLQTACRTAKCEHPNVEHILTQIRTICSLRGATDFDGMSGEALRKLDKEICSQIAKIVDKELPGHITAYHRFAAWLGQIERVYPVEVFTPNYDLLLEEALEQHKVPYFDGFVGAREPFFDLSAMEQDTIPTRWLRLWKLHGSINWVKKGDTSVYRCHPVQDQQLLIYPSHLKYDQSRRMPYLAMIDRLKAFFRDTNPVLVICGYSFADDHLNEVLLDGLRGNRSSQCFALMYDSLGNCSLATDLACRHSNLSVLASDGAVIGTRMGSYKPREETAAPRAGGAPHSSGGDLKPGRCMLGDFHYFALFLQEQFGIKVSEHH